MTEFCWNKLLIPCYKNMDAYELPEDTSLMRALKAHYLAGGYILDYNGVIGL